MTRCYFYFFFFLLMANQAFCQRFNYDSRLSLFSEIGLLNTDMLHSPVDITPCFECFGAEEIIPRTGIRWSIGAEIRVGKRSYIGAGYMANRTKYTERTPNIWDIHGSYFYEDVAFKFRGAILQYRYALLQRNGWQFSPTLGLQYDKNHSDKDYWGYHQLRGHSYSAYVKLGFSLPVGKWNQLTLDPIFKMAIRRYDKDYYSQKYFPFGYGLLIGWRTKLI
jgi:hypothetical protein